MGYGMTGMDLLRHKPLIDRYLGPGRHLLSAYSFAALFLWEDFFDFTFEVVDGQLCVLAAYESGQFLYWPPLGAAPDAQTAAACLRRMQAVSPSAGVARIENVELAQLSLFPPERFDHYLKGYETFYFKTDLIRMAGGAYKSRRAAYNHCARAYPCRYAPYTAAMHQECLALYDRWQARRREKYTDVIYRQMLTENRLVHSRALAHGIALGLTGRVVIVDGQARAYTFGYRVRDDIFCVLLEIADPDFRGMPAYVFREFCADAALGPARFINVMDDFSLPAVARAKMLFRPAFFCPAYTVVLKEGDGKVQ